MKTRLTVSWGDFALGVAVTWKERIAFGLGPLLIGIYWGPMLWRCAECQKLTSERLRASAALAGEEKP